MEVKLFFLNIGKIRMASFTCSHCGQWYHYERSLKRHVRSSHVNQPLFSCDQYRRSFNRAGNLQRHMCNCTVAVSIVAVPAAKKRCTGVAPERLQFKLQKTCEALKCNVQQFTVSMKEAKSLSTLKEATAIFKPAMMNFQQKHSTNNFKWLILL